MNCWFSILARSSRSLIRLSNIVELKSEFLSNCSHCFISSLLKTKQPELWWGCCYRCIEVPPLFCWLALLNYDGVNTMFDDFLFDLRLAEIFGRSNILGLKVISDFREFVHPNWWRGEASLGIIDYGTPLIFLCLVLLLNKSFGS